MMKDKKLIILFDGRCGLCGKTVRILRALDWLHRLEFCNFYDPVVREKYAPSLELRTLEEAMHVRKHDGSFTSGFFAFRTILGVLPLTFILQPLLFLPFVPTFGEKVYRYIASRRSSFRG